MEFIEELDFQKLEENENVYIFLDANVLLNAYRYSAEELEEYLDVFMKFKDRLCIPFFAITEYRYNRKKIWKKNKNLKTIFSTILEEEKKSFIKNIKNKFNNEKIIKCEKEKEQREKLFKKIEELADNTLEKFNKIILEYQDELLKNDKEIITYEILNDKLDKLIELNILDEDMYFTQEKVDEIQKEGTKRYKEEIPPGYDDIEKEGIKKIYVGNEKVYCKEKYGDLFIWHSILEKAKQIKKEDNTYFLFITDDQTEDWVKKYDEENDEARYELYQELKRISKNIQFYIYRSELFVDLSLDRQTEEVIETEENKTSTESLVSNFISVLSENKKNNEEFSNKNIGNMMIMRELINGADEQEKEMMNEVFRNILKNEKFDNINHMYKEIAYRMMLNNFFYKDKEDQED